MATKIEWTGETWNPITGCSAVSAGCTNCYAASFTKRLPSMLRAQGNEVAASRYEGLNNPEGHFNGVVRCHEDLLDIPLRRKIPTTWFVNSMSDLFHDKVPFEFVDQVKAVEALCPQHTFIELTKRPERAAEYTLSRESSTRFLDGAADELGYGQDGDDPDRCTAFWPPPNVWLGTSVEDQTTADERVTHLLRCPAAVRFLSCEPLLGPVSLVKTIEKDKGGHVRWFDCLRGEHRQADIDGPNQLLHKDPQARIHWIICGAESGPRARPMELGWARSIRDQCRAAGVAFFMKQICDRGRKVPFDRWPEDLKVREMPNG